MMEKCAKVGGKFFGVTNPGQDDKTPYMSSKNAKPHPSISRLGMGIGLRLIFFSISIVGTNSTAVVTENKSIHRLSKTFHPQFLTNLSHECLCLYVNACLSSMSAKTNNLRIVFSPWL